MKAARLAAIAFLFLIGCGGSDSPSATSSPAPSLEQSTPAEKPEQPEIADGMLEVTASEPLRFVTLPKAYAGPTKVVFMNNGNIGHELRIAPLGSGDDLRDLAQSNRNVVLRKLSIIGWTKTVLGGESKTLTVDLKPGRYGLFCLLGVSPDETHARHGMYEEIKVIKKA